MIFQSAAMRTVLLAIFVGLIILAGCSLGQPEANNVLGGLPASYERSGEVHLDLFPGGVFLASRPHTDDSDNSDAGALQPHLGRWALINGQRVLVLTDDHQPPKLFDSTVRNQLRPLDIDSSAPVIQRQRMPQLHSADLVVQGELIDENDHYALRDCGSGHLWPLREKTVDAISQLSQGASEGMPKFVTAEARFYVDDKQTPHLAVNRVRSFDRKHGCQ